MVSEEGYNTAVAAHRVATALSGAISDRSMATVARKPRPHALSHLACLPLLALASYPSQTSTIPCHTILVAHTHTHVHLVHSVTVARKHVHV